MSTAPTFLLILAGQITSTTAGPLTTEPETVEAQTLVEEEKDEAGVRADDFFTFSDFVDTRVTFAISNVNIFAGPGERLYQTSGYRIGTDPGLNLFLENVNTRFSG